MRRRSVNQKPNPVPEKEKEKSCKKCGKIVTRGIYLHEKHCNGRRT